MVDGTHCEGPAMVRLCLCPPRHHFVWATCFWWSRSLWLCLVMLVHGVCFNASRACPCLCLLDCCCLMAAARQCSGWTPLHYVLNGGIDATSPETSFTPSVPCAIALELLRRGADPTMPCNSGASPIVCVVPFARLWLLLLACPCPLLTHSVSAFPSP
jgi:hypothetical protein